MTLLLGLVLVPKYCKISVSGLIAVELFCRLQYFSLNFFLLPSRETLASASFLTIKLLTLSIIFIYLQVILTTLLKVYSKGGLFEKSRELLAELEALGYAEDEVHI